MTTTIAPMIERTATERLIRDRQSELAAYKAQVREQVLRMRQRHGWCESGTNAVLVRLRLQRLRRSYSGTTVVHIRIDHTPDSWHDDLSNRITRNLAVRFTDDRVRFSRTRVDTEGYPNIAVHLRIDELIGPDDIYTAQDDVRASVAIDFADTAITATVHGVEPALDERLD